MSEGITPRRFTAQELDEALGGGVLIFGVPKRRQESPQPSTRRGGKQAKELAADMRWQQQRLEGYRRLQERLLSTGSMAQTPESSPSPANTQGQTGSPSDGSPNMRRST